MTPTRALPLRTLGVGVALFLSACSTSSAFLTGPHAALLPQMDALLEQVGSSYFTVLVHKTDDATSGSGFLVDGSGYILTAGHVGETVGNGVQVRGLDQVIHSGTVVALRHSPDMALLKLDGLRGKPVTPVTQPCLAKNTPVFSIGTPRFAADTVRVGTVTSMHYGSSVRYGDFGYPDAMEVTLDTQVGESGGPLFTGEGYLAGMMVSATARPGSSPLRAHAIPGMVLAKFLCTEISCVPSWKRLARLDHRQCRD